ncbi:tetratricopeptide repeat-containing diguanylate cyclase [Colwellia sp. 1_MG-2023]|uniref:GGDEF domain-containing protein n=1 Tax=Colwellia sp. 1_MG-2023 TaxID=3062649 RepID=UPI0026E41E8C|nr:tetratricopeptide repeat-containing diguanylate cyclase [Colwellia sp. 1_MG-2023]
MLLITGQVKAWQAIENSTFDAFIQKAESLKDINVAQAFRFLEAQSQHLSSLSIENQLIYNKLLAELYVEQAQYQQGYNLASDALKLARGLTSPSITSSEILYARGFALESLGDYQAAREDYLNGLEIADSLNNKKILAIGLVNLGALDYLMEQFDRSLIMFNDALAIAQKINDDELLGYISGEMGILYSLINQEDKSLSYHKSAYEYYIKAGKVLYAINTLRNIASSHSVNERYEEAIEVYEQVLENINEISNNELIASVYSGMAWAQVKQKDSDPEASYQYMLIASQYIDQTEQVDIPIAHALDKGYLFLELGRYQEALDNMHIATEYLKQYEGSDQKIVTTISKLNLLYLKAETYFKIKDYQQAYQAQDEFISFALSLPEKSNVDETEDLRMRYESEQADLQTKILEQKESVQSLLLSDAKNEVKYRQIFITVFALVALGLAWILIKIIRGQKKLLRATITDRLTKVANRAQLLQSGDRLFTQAKTDNTRLSAVTITVDNLRQINLEHSHNTGDFILKKIAELGLEHINEQGVFARFDAGKFVVLLINNTEQQVNVIVDKIRLSIAQNNWSEQNVIHVSISIGIAHFHPDKHPTLASLLTNADLLKHQASNEEKNKVSDDE